VKKNNSLKLLIAAFFVLFLTVSTSSAEEKTQVAEQFKINNLTAEVSTGAPEAKIIPPAVAEKTSEIENILKFIPESPIFIFTMQNTGDAYNNLLGYGIKQAFPQLALMVKLYESTSSIKISEEASLYKCSIMSLTEVNLLLFNYEFIYALELNDTKKFDEFMEKWIKNYAITKKSITKIAGIETFSLAAAKIKTPLFYIKKDNFVIFSNKLEGLSKSIILSENPTRSFLNSVAYNQIKRKYDIDSNIYFWFSGKVIANYFSALGLVNANPGWLNTRHSMQLEQYSKIMNDLLKGLEFIAFKVNVKKDGVAFDFFVSLNELVAKVIKTKLHLSLPEEMKLNYDGIVLNSTRFIPEKVKAAAAAHIILPSFEELISSEVNVTNCNTNKVKKFNELNQYIVQKYKAGLDKLMYSWIANEFFAFVSDDSTNFAIGAKIKNTEALNDAIKIVEKSLSADKYKKSAHKYHDINIVSFKKHSKKGEVEKITCYFINGDYFVFASDPGYAKILIDTYADQLPSIRVNKDFQKVCAFDIKNKYKMAAFGNIAYLFEKIHHYIDNSLNLLTIAPEKMNIKNIGVSNFVTNDGQHLMINLSF